MNKRLALFHKRVAEAYPKVLAILKTIDYDSAEDVVQDAVVDALRAWKSYDAARPILPWLVRMAKHRLYDQYRYHGVRHDALTADLRSPLPSGPPDPPSILQNRELGIAITNAVESLLPNLRDVAVMHLVDDVPVAEVAERLHLSCNAVYHRVFRARCQLQEGLA